MVRPHWHAGRRRRCRIAPNRPFGHPSRHFDAREAGAGLGGWVTAEPTAAYFADAASGTLSFSTRCDTDDTDDTDDTGDRGVTEP